MNNTPYYFYDLHLLDRTLDEIERTSGINYKIHYAVKANNNKRILSQISSRGFGADCVSATEIQWALNAGFEASEIVFAGVGKTDEEIEFALTHRIGMLNCESLEEIQAVNDIAGRLGIVARIALRLNPNISARTHEKISTGLTENKFGLTSVEYTELAELYPTLANIQIVGLHFHIGSQILHLEVFEHLCQRINALVPEFEQFFGALEYLNVGGGLGIDYERPEENPIPDFERYFEIFRSNLDVPADFPVHFELGRAIVAQCGTLRAKVLYVKRGETKNFAVLDAGMTELLRPAMYGAKHAIVNLTGTAENRERGVYDIVGPICESSDTFATDAYLPQMRRGDIIEIRSCGAYVESMSLNYNGRGAIRSVQSQKVQTTLRVLKTA